jgi:hypothetical protein
VVTAPVLHWPKLFEGQVGLKKTSYGWENGWGNCDDVLSNGDGWVKGDDCEHCDGDGNGNGYGDGDGDGNGNGYGDGDN